MNVKTVQVERRKFRSPSWCGSWARRNKGWGACTRTAGTRSRRRRQPSTLRPQACECTAARELSRPSETHNQVHWCMVKAYQVRSGRRMQMIGVATDAYAASSRDASSSPAEAPNRTEPRRGSSTKTAQRVGEIQTIVGSQKK